MKGVKLNLGSKKTAQTRPGAMGMAKSKTAKPNKMSAMEKPVPINKSKGMAGYSNC